ncbi:DNA binding methylated-DNA--cysteine S-methyltransferase [Aulographum hederae CBS 113979]|uniref:DNA binding methylated-DNA--cysteine S-methyltransferase n=1 Tax=Aulographum hederae CBS 113979 TaxID=1176131 RepID=A0A6G1H2A2_9PEZI|nr:DNA binding methylated-DNA--cysteine S-methyltransferase [Aulographum hederae CBS 113979]
MPTEEAQAWFGAVYHAVQKVPLGRVTSYGHIARLIGYPERPRQVGVALKHLPSADGNSRMNDNTVPWQRVVNSKGGISPRGPDGARRQAEALRREGVQVDSNSMGELSVALEVYGWFPAELDDESDGA